MRNISIFRSLIVLLLIVTSTEFVSASRRNRMTPDQLRAAEQMLSDMGYWVLNIDGVEDLSTRHAITAFQKVQGLKRTGVLTAGVLESLRSAIRPQAKFNTGTAHVEVDITRQVLFLTDDAGVVIKILPVSTGSRQKYFENGKWQRAHTPRGSFKILRKINGIRHAPLGDLFYPNYFHNGVAIHGSPSIPPTPASHGCVRIPRFADRAFTGMVWVGMEVFVYD